MKFPIFSIDADTLQNYYPQVIRKYQVESKLYLHIPPEFSRQYVIFQIDQVAPKQKKLEIQGKIDINCNRPWILVDSSLLNFDIGMHKYRISMVSKHTNDVIELYFGYIMQDDNPEKPYIYMKDLIQEDVDPAVAQVRRR